MVTKTAIFLLPVKFVTDNLKFSLSDSYSITKFGGICGNICACLERKTAVVMQNLQNSGGRGEGYIFLVDTPKAHFR